MRKEAHFIEGEACSLSGEMHFADLHTDGGIR